jgi:lysozyme
VVSDIICQALPVARCLAKRSESFSAHAYLDPIGVATIGYGTVYYPNGRSVTLADPPITEPQASVLLTGRLSELAATISAMNLPSLTPGRLAALSDFAYNLGLGRLRGSTLLIRIRRNQWSQAPQEFRRWVHAGARVLPGLVTRREAEISLI